MHILAANAKEFTPQQTLAASDRGLLDWGQTVLRVEITQGSVVGSNESPPTVGFKIIEVLRSGNFFPGALRAQMVGLWLEDPAGGDQWQQNNLAGTLDQWSAIATVSPPVGTKLIVFIYPEQETKFNFLSKDSVFADTPVNRATALTYAAKEPLLHRMSEMAFWLAFLFSLAGLLALFYSPLLASGLSILAWPSYCIYNTQVHVSSNISIDLLFLYPALGVASLTAFAGVVLWLKSNEPD